MATEIAAAYVTLIPSLKGANDSITKQLSGMNLTGAGNSMGNSVGKGFSATFMGVVGGLTATVTQTLGNAIASSLGSAISRVDTINNFPKTMANLGYSADDAAASIAKIQEELTGLPTTTDSMVSLVQSLAPITGGLEEATDVGLAFNNMLLASGRSTVDQSRAMLQYTQMLAKGKPDLMAWRTMQEVMPGQLNQMAQALLGAGKNSSDLYDAMLDGSVSFEDFNEMLLKLNTEGINGFASFEKQARDSTGGIRTAMTNVSTAISRSVANIIQAFGASGIATVINDFGSLISKIGKLAVPIAEKMGEAFFGLYNGLKTGNFEDTPLEGLVGKIRGFISAVKIGTSPVALLKNYWQEFVRYAGSTASSALDTLKAKIETLPQPVQNIINKIVEFGAKVGEAFGGISIGGAAGIAVFAGILSKFGAPLTAVVTGVVNFGAKVAGVFSKLGGFAGIIATFGSKLRLLGSAVTLCGGGLKGLAVVLGSGLRTALAGLLSPVSLVVVGIAAVAAAFAYMMSTSDSFRETVMTLVASIGSSFAPVFTTIATTVKNLAANVLPVLTNAFQAIAPVLANVVVVIMEIAAAIAPIIAQLVGSIVPVLGTIVSVVVNIVASVLPAVSAAINVVLAAIRAAIPVVSSVISVVVSVVSAIISAVGAVIAVVGNVVASIGSAVSAVIGFLANALASVYSVFGAIAGTVAGAISAVVSCISGGFQKVMNFISDTANSIGSCMTTLFNKISGIFNEIAATVQNAVSTAFNAARTAFNNMVSTVSNAIGNMLNSVRTLPSQIRSSFANAGSWLVSAGSDIIKGLWNGIASVKDWLMEKITGLGGSIVDWAKSALGIASPSKVFANDVGAWIPAGIGMGIEENMGSALGAISSMNSALLEESENIAPFDSVSADVRTWRNVEFTDDTESMGEVIDLLREYLPGMAEEKGVFLNEGTLVGKLAKPMNRELGKLNRRAGALC